MKIFKEDNFATMYSNVLKETLFHPDYVVSPHGNKTHELSNVALELTDPRCNFFTNPIRSPSVKYLTGELLWYFSGSDSIRFIRHYSKFWDAIANPDGTCNSAYGHLLFNEKNEYGFTEWGWALYSLCSDRDTRQAIIRFNKPRFSYEGNLDFVCTLNGNFFIRNNALHFIVFMRSNDLRTGIQYDVPFFTLLQSVMWKQLLPYYPDLQLGTYTHFVNSIHLYEKDFEESEAAIKQKYTPKKLPEIGYLIPITEYGMPSCEYVDLAKGIVHVDIQDAFYQWITISSEITKIKL